MANNIERRIYTARDYDSWKERLLFHLQSKYPTAFNDFHEGHFGVVVIEAISKLADDCMYYMEHNFNEIFIDTCGERKNMTSIVKLIDYRMRNRTAATVLLSCTCDPYYPETLTIPAGTVVLSKVANIQFTIKQEYQFTGDTTFQVEAIEGFPREDIYVATGKTHQSYQTSFDSVVDNVDFELYVDSVLWDEVDTLWNVDTGNYYERYHTDDLRVEVRFGDNIHGNIPPSGAEIKLVYGTGAGIDGNVDKTKIDTTFEGTLSGPPNVLTINANNNNNAASGGDNEESVDEARVNAPLSLKAVKRLITADDYKGYALSFPGVLAASVRIDNILNVVTVYVVANGYQLPNPGLLTNLKNALEAERVVGLVIDVQEPELINVDVGGEIIVEDNYALLDVQRTVEAAILDYFQPDNPIASGKDFGQDIRFSDVVRLIDEQEGVDYVNLERLSKVPVVFYILWHSNPTTGAKLVNVNIGTTAKQEMWTIRATSYTKFQVIGSVSGLQQRIGTVNELYNSDEGEIGFTLDLGTPPDELEPGDIARIRTSAYVGNLQILDNEFTLMGNVNFSYRYERVSLV